MSTGSKFDAAMMRHRLHFMARMGIGLGVILGAYLGAPSGYVIGLGGETWYLDFASSGPNET